MSQHATDHTMPGNRHEAHPPTSTPVPRSKLRAYLALTKPRIVELLLVTTVPVQILAANGFPSGSLILWTVVGGALAAGGANTLNMVVDRDIDRLMERTRTRPLATGEITPRAAVVFATCLELAAFVVLWVVANLLSGVLAIAATAFYVGVYTLWLKRTSTQNIVIGGAAGAVPVLIGRSSVTGSLDWPPIILFAVVFMWTPPHFWCLAVRFRDDYAAANVPMLPVVAAMRCVTTQIVGYTVALVALTIVLAPIATTGRVYLATAIATGTVYLALSIDLHRAPTTPKAMRLFHWSIAYLTVLFAAIALDPLLNSGDT